MPRRRERRVTTSAPWPGVVDCVLLVGETYIESEMYNSYPALKLSGQF